MSHETGPHHAAKRAAEVGAAGAAVIVTGALVKYIMDNQVRVRREREQAVDPDMSETYLERLAILDEMKIEPKIRRAMALLAVKVHHASVQASDMVISRSGLRERLDISRDDFGKAMGYLRDNELVGRAPRISNPKSFGYYELPALKWAFQLPDPPMALLEADSELINDSFLNDN